MTDSKSNRDDFDKQMKEGRKTLLIIPRKIVLWSLLISITMLAYNIITSNYAIGFGISIGFIAVNGCLLLASDSRRRYEVEFR